MPHEKAESGEAQTVAQNPSHAGGAVAASGFMSDFAKFIDRGNVVDMAVAVLMSNAFGLVAWSLVGDVWSPFIALAIASWQHQGSLSDRHYVLQFGRGNGTNGTASGQYKSLKAAEEDGAITLNWGKFLQNVINFAIVVTIVFVVIKLVYFFARRRDAKSTDLECPACFEKIRADATRCKFCTARINRSTPSGGDITASKGKTK